jgi:hypothetical protein
VCSEPCDLHRHRCPTPILDRQKQITPPRAGRNHSRVHSSVAWYCSRISQCFGPTPGADGAGVYAARYRCGRGLVSTSRSMRPRR